MTRIRTSGVSGASENSIIFIPAGGHSHDGVTSSLISTEKYSIYDFSPTFINSTQSQTRAVRQENNRLAFESLVVNIVNQSVLVPAGIRLTPNTLNASAIMANTITAVHLAANTITADEIAANTITADELVSNIILVNNIIRSNSFQSGVGGNGWQIEYDGSAEFNDVVVRGNVFSNVGTIGGWTLSSNSLASGTGSTTLHSNGAAVLGNTTIAANGRITNGSFTLSSTGALTATNVDITGAVTATSGSFTGAVTATSGSFTGTVTSTSGRVGPFTLSSSGLTNVTDTGYSQSNFMRVQNYGDVTIFSNPSSGPHTNAFHRTDIFGENITISRHADQANMLNGTYLYPYLALGSFTNGQMELTIVTGSGTNAFRANSDGTASASYTFSAEYFVGSGRVTVGSSLSTALRRRDADGFFLELASKRELKKDIITIENGLDVIQKLNPVSFRWKDESSYDHYSDEIKNLIKSRKEYGFIAEEVESSVPDLAVYQSSDNGSKITPSMWQENGVISLCVASIKELLTKTNSLEGRIQELENKV
jgi:hypothetical protein